MGINFDRTLKEKLESYEAPFHPSDWHKMEAMLPKDSGKFFFAVAALFALLLLGIAGLMVNNVLNPQVDNAVSMPSPSVKGIEIEPGYGGTVVNWKTIKAETQRTAGEIQSSSGEKIYEAGSNESASGSQQAPERQLLSDNSRSRQKDAPGKAQTDKARSEKKKNAQAEGKSHLMNGIRRKTHDKWMTPSDKTTAGVAEETITAEMLARHSAGLIAADYSEQRELSSVQEMTSVVGGKKKRKVFRTALGIVAGADVSFIDSKNLTKPGYSAGFSQEFMFIERIGLTLTESYIHRRYDGGAYPCSQTTGNQCPLSYNSGVQSADFGIDVKANLIHKARWGWYAKAGVINTLKLKETFDYTYQNIDSLPPPPPLPAQAAYGNEPDALGNFDSAVGGGVQTGKPPLPDLTISGTNRYHIAYRVASGFDVLLSSKLKLQFEAGYSFTKPTAGADNNRRLRSLGCNGGLLLLLGK